MTEVQMEAGFWVGHANPEFPDWEGTITADGRGRWGDRGYVRVLWHKGTADAGGLPVTGWVEATSLTLQGSCPDCARPAHYVYAGNPFDRTEGWYHDEAHDRLTCWVGKAAFEARVNG
jgi:hypothetical protein